MFQSQVVVGVNGSPSSLRAVEHAAAEASRRHLPVHLVHAWEAWPLYEGAGLLPLDEVQQAEAGVLDEAVAHLREIAPDLEVTAALVQERADVALLDASRSAALLVLGRHAGSRAWTGPVLGHVTARATCPVVAVPADAPRADGDVVVGVDGSAVSAAAVDVAFSQSSLRGRRLVALLAVTPTFDAYVASAAVLEELRERGRRHLAEALAGSQERYPDVEVVAQVRVADALPALLEAAKDAALLVVGSHGRGALLRAALGSVSSSLLRVAPCPVLVVRPAPQDRVRVPGARGEDVVPVPLL